MSNRVAVALVLILMSIIVACSDESDNKNEQVQQSSSENDQWIAMMARVPASAADDESLIYFADWKVPFEVRHVGVPVESMAELFDLDDSETLRLIFAIYTGMTTTPPEFQNLRVMSDMPTSVGFDFLDIDTSVYYGRPPADVTILHGEFDAASIQGAFAARDYTRQQDADLTLMCGANGCNSGTEIDRAKIDATNPFGGRIGREQPILFSDDFIISSADYTAIQTLQSTRNESESSILTLPDYRAAIEGATRTGTLIQCVIVPPAIIGEAFNIETIVGTSAIELLTPEQLEAIKEQYGLNQSPEELAARLLPDYSLIFIADVVEGDEQVVYIGLIYDNQEAAQLASDRVESAVNTYVSLVTYTPLPDLLEARNASLAGTQVVFNDPTDRYITLIAFRAPMPSNEPDERGQYERSSSVYGLFYQFLTGRDLGWLATPAWFEQ